MNDRNPRGPDPSPNKTIVSRSAKPVPARGWVHPLVIVVATVAVFSNILDNEMHLDSVHRVRDNPEIERFWPPWRHFVDARTSTALSSIVVYRPMLPLSLTINVAISDGLGIDRLAGFHFGNVLIHLGTCLLLYLLFLDLLQHWSRVSWPIDRRRNVALVATLLFAVHPVAGVPVNYVCARDLLMMMFFLTAALLVYVRMRRRGQAVGGWILLVGLLALSLLSKQNSLIAPLLVLAFEVVVAGSALRSWKTWAWPLGIGAAVLTYFVYSDLTTGLGLRWSGGSLTSWEYGLTMTRAHTFYYLRNVVWPFRMRALPAFEPAEALGEAGVVIGLLVVIASLVLAVALSRRLPTVSFSILAYWILFAPTSSIQPFRFLVLDYRQYPSLAFFCFALAVGLGHLPKRALVPASLLLVTFFGASTLHLNTIWRSEESFWAQSVRYGALPMGHLAYARVIEDGTPDLAQAHYLEALRGEPGNVYALFNLAFLYIRQGRDDDALVLAHRAVRSTPDWGFAHFWLAETYRALDRRAEAAEASTRAAELDPKNVEYQYVAALDLQELADYAGSLPYLQRVAGRVPGYKRSRFHEARALSKLERWDEAEPRYRSYLESRPDDAEAWFELGGGLFEAQRWDEAAEAFQRVLQSDSDGTFTSAHHWLFLCYREIGDLDRAAHHEALASEDGR